MVDHPLRDEINDLARKIGELHGFAAPQGFRFYMATTEIAEFCWNVATVVVYNDIMTSGRDVDLSETGTRRRVPNRASTLSLH